MTSSSSWLSFGLTENSILFVMLPFEIVGISPCIRRVEEGHGDAIKAPSDIL